MKARARLAAAFCALAASAAFAQDDDLGEHLHACAACHGEHGEGLRGADYFPHLAGKPAQYLFEQLKGFRDGRRENSQMTWFVRFADDEFLQAIAQHYAALAPRTRVADASGTALASAQRTMAQTLVEHGDPSRRLPACVECHGRNLAGLDPGVPALVALPADYIAAQIGSWRDGIRKGASPDCMHDVAMALRPDEIHAVATWLSQQSNPEGVRPASAGSFVLPRACGELPHADGAP
ncbi:MAG TPA: c-type cytochrome [Rudaea sp.]